MFARASKIVLFCLATGCCAAQTALRFETLFGREPLALGKPYAMQKGLVSVSRFRFYVSHVRLFSHGTLVSDLDGSYFLVDASDEASKSRVLPIDATIAYDEIAFTFGIDKKTNENGIGERDLDPSKGMYWAWQTGYVNCKIEGEFGKKPFEFHLGGFEPPFESARDVRFKLEREPSITIGVDVSVFLDAQPFEETHVMSPGKPAMALSDQAAKMFRSL